MIFPTERYGEFERWIPETDLDGVDSKNSILSYVENVDLENGFIKNAVAPSERILNTSVRNLLIDEGWELIDIKLFKHSIRGNIFFYILWKDDSYLKFFVEEIDNSTIEELFLPSSLLFDHIGNITEKPTLISYSLVENQFKINLNVNSFVFNSNNNSDNVILNLTLTYLKEDIVYKEDDADHTLGWYLTPRWLGWSNPVVNFNVGAGWASSLETDFNGTLPTWFNVGTGEQYDTGGRLGKILNLDSDEYCYIDNIYLLKTITLRMHVSSGVGVLQCRLYDTVNSEDLWIGEIQVDSENSTAYVRNSEISALRNNNGGRGTNTTYPSPSRLDQILTVDNIGNNSRLYIENVSSDDNTISLYTLKLESGTEDNLVIVSKNIDGQRALMSLQSTYKLMYVPDTVKFGIYLEEVDWRVQSYEVYFQFAGLYYLVQSIDVDGDWTYTEVDADHKLLEYTFAPIFTSTTLNFNYGLGISVGVNNQKIILSEVFYRGRTYFVNQSEKVFQSHLSGTGQYQPDSFPYDEDVRFGYFITSNNEVNQALAISPLNELVIITKNHNYVYYIQGGQGIVYRELKVIDGGKGISSIKSLATSYDGIPEAEVLMWSDDIGIYIYGGGANSPLDISKATHRNYWLKKTNTSESIGFYVKAKNEYWQMFDDEIFIYELSFKSFKRYVYPFTVKEYIGELNDVLYLLDTNNKIRVIDFQSESKMSGYIITHYNTNTVVVGQYPIKAPEHETKILQEIYIAVKNKEAGIIKYVIIYDENTYDEIYMRTDILTDLLPAPLLIRYGKIKIKLILPPSNAEIRELGYSFDVPGQAPAQAVQTAIQGIGMSSGKQAGIGL